MAVQQILGKKIIKHDLKNPNYKSEPKPEVVVNGNVKEDRFKCIRSVVLVLTLICTSELGIL